MPSPTLPDDKGDKGCAPPFGTALSPSGSSRKGVSPASPLQSTGAWTPGPWSASRPDGTYHDVIRIFADADPEGALPIAICPQRKSAIMEVLSGSSDDTTEAAHNARLMTAAPELFEALAAMLSSFDDRQLNPNFKPFPAVAMADAALAKARGK